MEREENFMFGNLSCILIGLLQTGENVCGSTTMRKGSHPLDYGFHSTLVATVIMGIYVFIKNLFFGDIKEAAAATDFARVLPIMVLGGVISCIAVVANLSAMKLGHIGITNGIYQSSFALNFLLMVIFFHAGGNWISFLAVAIMLAGVLCMAIEKEESGGFNKKWLFFCSVAFVFNALGQFVTTIPSQYNYPDGMDIRGFSILLAMTVCYGVAKKAMHVETNKAGLKVSCLGGLVFAGVQLGTYPVMDLLAKSNSVHLFTPIMLMTVTVLFSLYSRFFLKEKFRKLQYAGLVCCLTGILLFMI